MKRPGLIRGIFFVYLMYLGIGVVQKLHQYQVDTTIPMVTVESTYLHPLQTATITHALTTLHEQYARSVIDSIIQVSLQFPYITSGCAQFVPGSLVAYHFETSELVCRVNQRYVLTHAGALCADEICDQSVLSKLPAIYIDEPLFENTRTMRILADAVMHIDRAILDAYTLRWQGSTQATLSSEHIPQLQIVCDVHHLPTESLLEQCKRIQHEIASDTQKYKGSWLADIRFAKQIVMYRDRGGRYG